MALRRAVVLTPASLDGKRGSLVALDAATGKQIWKTYTIPEEPHITGKTKTGKPMWAIDLGDDGPSSPACEDGVCVVSTESCTIFAIEAPSDDLAGPALSALP